MFRNITYAGISAGLSVLIFPTAAFALCLAAKDMNGVWKADDGGTYYVRQIRNDVWWVGMSPDDGKSWTNVFKGVRNGNKVTGTWGDVPGRNRNAGALNLEIQGTFPSVQSFTKTQSPTGVGASRWFQTSCDDR